MDRHEAVRHAIEAETTTEAADILAAAGLTTTILPSDHGIVVQIKDRVLPFPKARGCDPDEGAAMNQALARLQAAL